MSRMRRQSGAVSLFVVIFAILLLSVVTVSFLRIMTNDQNQASNNDLSQSAYDSAKAGVEDAKRALIWYSQNCSGSSPASGCNAFLSSISECNTAIVAAGVIRSADIVPTGGAAGTGEVRVQQSTAVNATGQSRDAALNQAYTCVTMQLNTPDYVGNLSANESILVPLAGTAATNRVTVEWFSTDDLTNTIGSVAPSTTVGSQPLLRQTDWPTDRPSVMRAQFMQVGDTFRLTDFDSTTDNSESNANTVFLYPTVSGNTATGLVARDSRRDSSGDTVPDTRGTTPLPTRCETSISGGGYACRITLTLPTPVGGGAAETAYLRLTSLYVRSHFRVTLAGAQFEGVQPLVDATGRANDVFRRIQNRVDLFDTSFPYPDAAVDTAQDFCKDFGVTDRAPYDAGACTP